jgi:hypothetical protein
MVTSGVPQGSVIGPTLFLAYINAVTELILGENSRLILYADDMVLTHPLDSEYAAQQIQLDVDKISSCINDLGLSLNTSKCQYEVISLASSKHCFVVSLNGAQLQQVNTYKYLGVDMDDKLTFAHQTSRVVNNAKKGLGILSRSLRKWATRKVFSAAVTTIVLPAFFYAIEAWYPPHLKQQEKLERVIKYAARLASNNFSAETSYETLLKSLQWKPLFRIVAERRLLTIKKYMDGVRFLPDLVFPVESIDTNRCSQRLREKQPRHCLTLMVQREHKNKMEDNLAAAQMRILWNALREEDVKLSVNKFKGTIESDDTYNMLCAKNVISVLHI